MGEVYSQTVYLEWVDDPLESIVVNWIDDGGLNSSVEYRKIGAGSWSQRSGSNQGIPGPTSKRLYTVKLNQLDAGQGYEFRVAGSSEIFKFRTAPQEISQPIRFIVAGDILDTGESLEEAKEDFTSVSKYAASYNPYFVVVGGDIANAEAQLENVDQWFFLFETWEREMVTDDGFLIPLVAAVGNNEVDGNFGMSPDEAPFFYTFFSYPQDQWGSRISYGRLDFNKYLTIVTLDSDHTHRIPGTQTSWLNNTLRNRDDVRHIVPVYHVAGWPTFLARTFVGVQENLVRNNWHKVFRDNDVRLVFEHHDHIYKRTQTIGDCEDEITNQLDCVYGDDAKDGVIYMGGGSWGSDNNRTAEKRWYHQEVVDKIHNFVVVEIDNNKRTATAIGENGQVLDEFTDYVYLDPPVALAPSNVDESGFTARWEAVEGATHYRIDISTNQDFSSTLFGIGNRNVGDRTDYSVDDLDPTKVYYYRVRAENELTTSSSSETVTVQLVKVDPELSQISASVNQLVADGEDVASISVTIIDEDGVPVPNFDVELFAKQGNLGTDSDMEMTNDEGVAVFEVYNDRPEVVTYGARAGLEELSNDVQITYIPVAPVALSATSVQTRGFQANWEVVDMADSYLLDVATDNEFSNILPQYQALNTGNVTSWNVSALNPGQTYFYRVRAVGNDLVGVNSQTVSTTTFPETPVASDATNVNSVRFRANWSAAEGAQAYRLDVATDSNFEQILEGYQNLDVGSELSTLVTDLRPDRSYFYRVRSVAGPRVSENSNSVQTRTEAISSELSEIVPDQLRVLANGEQANTITVTIRSESGGLQQGVGVVLEPENGSSEIEPARQETDDEGTASFSVTNTTAETVTYNVLAAGESIGTISLEFLRDEGIVILGKNFPNPFRLESSIPVTIPSQMNVELVVYNSLGNPVRTLLNETVEEGYYEIPFVGADLAAGVYFYRLRADGETKVGKMLLVK